MMAATSGGPAGGGSVRAAAGVPVSKNHWSNPAGIPRPNQRAASERTWNVWGVWRGM